MGVVTTQNMLCPPQRRAHATHPEPLQASHRLPHHGGRCSSFTRRGWVAREGSTPSAAAPAPALAPAASACACLASFTRPSNRAPATNVQGGNCGPVHMPSRTLSGATCAAARTARGAHRTPADRVRPHSSVLSAKQVQWQKQGQAQQCGLPCQGELRPLKELQCHARLGGQRPPSNMRCPPLPPLTEAPNHVPAQGGHGTREDHSQG